MRDAVDLWSSESAASQPTATLTPVRLDGNLRPFVLFTTSVMPVILHYLKDPALKGYVRCNGDGCVLCKAGLKKEPRDLLPVHDYAAAQIGILPVGPAEQAGALRPILRNALPRVKNGERLVLNVRRLENYSHEGTVSTASAQVLSRATPAIEAFDRRIKAGEIDLAGTYPSPANETLADLETVKLVLEAGGMQ
jgi:hypothetical protein